MLIGSREFDFFHQTYLMGVLNLTPDSFYDGGRYLDPGQALDRALQIEEEGAQILDIGAESSRPGSQSVTVEEERRRLIPVLKKIRPRLRIPISVDTQKSTIADEALQEGANLINDISALRFDFRMGEVIAQAGVPCILMHMRGEPSTMQQDVRYLNVVSEIMHFLKEQIQIAVRVGISRDRLLVDPGIGFGKEVGHNLEILRSLLEFRLLEAPVVIGASRKSFVRRILGIEEADSWEIGQGSIAVAVLAAWKDASLLRVHDLKETVQALKIVQALKVSPHP